ncbi:DUF4435 domain-containing protein [Colwellia sp. 4_MG-2023]|uniref:DUF4435 domain-containing protein n=1 Tax=unclassified Colwellia TaxID=196834 RepID=UPI0026E1F185|nr:MULTISPECIES: DUF4435 domain-containing protein [unclassified Colwellia]MDO6508683.1 DUF4435 domain-containing protein [Colwellia sp. 5_MG-2023]MDO6557345.1 DUF4435 domain-containing protein [Colwellia sp. 4_MG-2023]
MDRVLTMQKHGSSYSVKLLEFSRIYSKNKDNLICLFEGQDEKYYTSRVDNFIGKGRWQGINSGGRRVVTDLYDVINKHPIYKESNYCCFIDHDYQDWYENPDNDRIYVTSGYSIENYYVSEPVFKDILSSEFNITEFNEHSVDYTKCIQAFNARLEEFNSCVLPFNCWAKAHRLMEYRKQAPRTLNIQNIKIDELVSISIEKVEKAYGDSPENLFKDYEGLSLCPVALKDAQDNLNTKNLTLAMRGKQQLEFLRMFLIKLKTDRGSKTPSFFSAKGKVILSLTKDNCISELSQYAETPECLTEFLTNVSVRMAA